MNILTLKLILTPALIGAASLAGRRWGPAVSGWLIGLPFTTGPITFFLALSQGTAFAQAAALGTLAGGISEVAFCLGYGWTATRFPWPLAALASALAFGGATALLQFVSPPTIILFPLILVVLALGLRLMPRFPNTPPVSNPPAWDLPARMVLATLFVLGLTSLAPNLGARLTGLLAPYPIYATILAVFAHHQQGPAAANSVMRGLIFGLFAFAGFFLTLASLIEQVNLGLAFLAAILVALTIQTGSLLLMRQNR